MIELIYGFFGEDEGQGIFLQQYLLKINQIHSVLFRAHPWYSKRFKGINNKGVDTNFRAAWLAGFAQKDYRLDCLFIGRDLDADTSNIREKRIELFEKKIEGIGREDWRARTIFILPMQCIEHWLLALQRRADGRPSSLTRNLEPIINDAVKNELYNHKSRLPEQTKDEFVTSLSAEIDIDWLADQSPSFRAFHEDVLRYLSRFSSVQDGIK